MLGLARNHRISAIPVTGSTGLSSHTKPDIACAHVDRTSHKGGENSLFSLAFRHTPRRSAREMPHDFLVHFHAELEPLRDIDQSVAKTGGTCD